MALFSSVFRRLFERFAHFLRRRETQPCAAQELAAVEKLPEECEAFNFTADDRKCRKRRRKVPEKCQLGERVEEREVKNEGKISHKDEAEKERETLRLERIKIKKNGHVHQKKREMHSLEKLMEGGSELREAGEKKRKKRKRKQRKTAEPTPLLVEVKPLHSPVRSSFLKPIEGELPVLPSVSEHLALPAAHFQPLPPVTKPPVSPGSKPPPQVDPPKLLAVPPCPNVVSLQPSSSQVRPSKPQTLPLAVPPRPTLVSDEVFSSSQGRHPKRLPLSPTSAPDEVVALRRPPSRKPQPFTSSLFVLPPELMLVDIEDEENEYVEYTGKTYRVNDLLKSERPQTPEAEIKPRKMVAWLEKDSEVQEEAWESEVVEEVQGFEEEDPSEMGDSCAIQAHASQKTKTDELMMNLFCVISADGPKNETQHTVNIQDEKSKRKMSLFRLTWTEENTKKKEEKKIIKEKERQEKELLLERYTNDPKLKHLWINKHNRNYCF